MYIKGLECPFPICGNGKYAEETVKNPLLANIDGMIIFSSKCFPNSGSCSLTSVSKSNRHFLSRGRSSGYSPLNGVFAQPLSSTTITQNAFS